jgi:hypothetical protein
MNAAPVEGNRSEPGKKPRGRFRKLAFLAIRVLVCAGLLSWVIRRLDLHQVADLARSTDRSVLVLGLLVEALPVLFTTWRWHLLLVPVGLSQPFLRSFHLNYVGLFFNNFLLGLTGGDVVKAVLIAHGAERKPAAVLTVFVDRLLGLIALAGIAAAACLTRLGAPEFRLAGAIVWGFLLAFATFCTAWFWLRENGWVRRLRSRVPGRKLLEELDAAAAAYRHAPGAVAGALLLSLASHSCSLAGAWLFARALGHPIPLTEILVYYPVIMMLVSLPISVGTWGVGEAAFIAFFRKVGTPEPVAVALSLLVRLGQALWTLPGGLFLLFDPADRKAAQEAEEDD